MLCNNWRYYTLKYPRQTVKNEKRLIMARKDRNQRVATSGSHCRSRSCTNLSQIPAHHDICAYLPDRADPRHRQPTTCGERASFNVAVGQPRLPFLPASLPPSLYCRTCSRYVAGGSPMPSHAWRLADLSKASRIPVHSSGSRQQAGRQAGRHVLTGERVGLPASLPRSFARSLLTT